jgi:hypothetical protein
MPGQRQCEDSNKQRMPGQRQRERQRGQGRTPGESDSCLNWHQVSAPLLGANLRGLFGQHEFASEMYVRLVRCSN